MRNQNQNPNQHLNQQSPVQLNRDLESGQHIETSPQSISAFLAFFDRCLGRGVVNTVLPPAAFAAIGNLSPATLKAFGKMLGPHLPKFMPAINLLGVPVLITAIETGCRYGCGALGKNDNKVKVPGFSLSRQQAILMMVLGGILQTVNGCLAEYDPSSEAFADMNMLLAKDGFVAFGLQCAMTLVADRAINSFTDEQGFGYRAAACVGNTVSSACGYVSRCCSSLFVPKTHEQTHTESLLDQTCVTA